MGILNNKVLKAQFRIYASALLWRIGVRSTLPSIIVNRVPIRENNDPLREIEPNAEFLLDSDSFSQKKAMIRGDVYQRLLIAKSFLPQGYTLKVYDAYRSLEEQQASWDRRFAETKKMYPDKSPEDVIRLTKLKVANPYNGGFGGHQTGGAVDVALVDAAGCELEMGCGVSEYTLKTPTKNKALSPTERWNRNLLLNSMSKAGFVNFPMEWWHYCYGDRMWAAYQRKPYAIYGRVEPR